MTLNSQFINLNKKIIACKKCKRLKNFREKIAKKKRKQYINEKYWGKPITGFGDLSGKILLVGLHLLHMEEIELAEYLQVINLQNFYTNVYIKQKCLIKKLRKIEKMV